MMKKAVTSLLILAVGLTIISGAVFAKDQIFERVLIEEKSPVVASTGEVGVIIPADFVPGVYKPTQFEGLVAAVDLNDGLFDLSVDGTDLRAFFVDSRTHYQGDLTGFEDINAEMQVSVLGFQEEDGTWFALSVFNQSPVEALVVESVDNGENGGTGENGDVQEPPTNGDPKPEHPNASKVDVGGRVTTVGADTLTIQTKDGTPMTFAIGPETMINSHVGSHDSLDDIKVNFTVAVIYFEGDMLNGYKLAYRVVVANEGIAFNPYQQGWVDSVGGDQFTITTNFGSTFTFMVNGSTQVRGVGSFGEITAGMRAFVYYQDDGGTLYAKGIQVWPAP